MPSRHLRALLAAIAATVLAASAAAAKDPLLKYHPGPGAVPGLTVVEGSHQHGAGDGITAIYNGGFERFTKAGVTRASQRYYKLDGQTLELVIHELKTPAAARTFFEASCKDGKAAVAAVKLGRKAGAWCAVAADGAAFGYLVYGRYFVSTSLDKAVDAGARVLLKAAGERLAGVKPKPRKK